MSDIVEKLRLIEEQFKQHDVPPGMIDAVEDARKEIERLREAIRMMVRLDKCASPDVYRVAKEALGDEG